LDACQPIPRLEDLAVHFQFTMEMKVQSLNLERQLTGLNLQLLEVKQVPWIQ
jgi:hypothetical protein